MSNITALVVIATSDYWSLRSFTCMGEIWTLFVHFTDTPFVVRCPFFSVLPSLNWNKSWTMSGATNMCIFIKAYVGTGGVLNCISELDALQKKKIFNRSTLSPTGSWKQCLIMPVGWLLSRAPKQWYHLSPEKQAFYHQSSSAGHATSKISNESCIEMGKLVNNILQGIESPTMSNVKPSDNWLYHLA